MRCQGALNELVHMAVCVRGTHVKVVHKLAVGMHVHIRIRVTYAVETAVCIERITFSSNAQAKVITMPRQSDHNKQQLAQQPQLEVCATTTIVADERMKWCGHTEIFSVPCEVVVHSKGHDCVHNVSINGGVDLNVLG